MHMHTSKILSYNLEIGLILLVGRFLFNRSMFIATESLNLFQNKFNNINNSTFNQSLFLNLNTDNQTLFLNSIHVIYFVT